MSRDPLRLIGLENDPASTSDTELPVVKFGGTSIDPHGEVVVGHDALGCAAELDLDLFDRVDGDSTIENAVAKEKIGHAIRYRIRRGDTSLTDDLPLSTV